VGPVACGSRVLSPSSPAEQRLSPSKPRGLGCRRSGSSGRPLGTTRKSLQVVTF